MGGSISSLDIFYLLAILILIPAGYYFSLVLYRLWLSSTNFLYCL